MAGIKVAFGGAVVVKGRLGDDESTVHALYDMLEKYDVKIIDTAQFYGESEQVLGQTSAGKRFIIDTKAPGGFVPGSATKENIMSSAKESLKKLNVDKVDIFYIHAPDGSIPLSETLAGIDSAHKSGDFERFGLSNYQAKDVQAVYDHCKAHDYVLPTVYQGNYNPVARKQESVLFPTLRKLGISFYAYSPIAGGFLTKTKQQVLDGMGRFDAKTPLGSMYSGMYSKPAYLEALAEWETVAKDEGCSRADLAYRWVTYNSSLKRENGDAIIVGARTLEQLEQTMKGLNSGPLSTGALKKIDHIWETIKHEAPLDNYHR